MPTVSVIKVSTFSGHTNAIFAITESQDNTNFISSGADGYVTQWDYSNPENGTLLAKVPNSVYALALRKDVLVIGHNYDGIHLLNIKTKTERGNIKLTSKQIFDIRMSGATAYIGTGEGELIKLDTVGLRVLERKTYTDQSLRSISIHPDQSHLALGYSDNRIRIVEAETLKVIDEFEAHENSVFKVLYSHDGKTLLSGGRDASLKIWNTESYKKHFECTAHMWTINDIAFSPDNKHFVTCSMDKSIKIWDAFNYKLLKVIDKDRDDSHSSSVNKVMWNSEGHIVSVSDDRTIMLWDIKFEK